jgi:hypothetical protein
MMHSKVSGTVVFSGEGFCIDRLTTANVALHLHGSEKNMMRNGYVEDEKCVPAQLKLCFKGRLWTSIRTHAWVWCQVGRGQSVSTLKLGTDGQVAAVHWCLVWNIFSQPCFGLRRTDVDVWQGRQINNCPLGMIICCCSELDAAASAPSTSYLSGSTRYSGTYV